jgi:hypothetical protein
MKLNPKNILLISVIYPYFHISRSNTLQKSSYIKSDSNEWLEQGTVYVLGQ